MKQILCKDFYNYEEYVLLSSDDDLAIINALKDFGCEIHNINKINIGDKFYPISDKYSCCTFVIVNSEDKDRTVMKRDKTRELSIGGIYRHFKGNFYKVLNVATHTETQEKLVVYQALYGNYGIFARPYEMFLSKTDKNKYPEATQEWRMELCIESNNDISK